MGGYDDTPTGSGFDPTYQMRFIAQSLGLSHPVTKLDVARYILREAARFHAGHQQQVPNFGYLLAGAVVEKVTNSTFFNYVKTALLQPAGPRSRGVADARVRPHEPPGHRRG
jgi:CubicO group peptidase (beta-lactamase class C family)